MHGGVVLVAQACAVFPHTFRLALLLVSIALVHTVQDYVKVRYAGRWFAGQPLVDYFADQILHFLLLMAASAQMARIVGEPSPAVQWSATVATAFIVVTWAYHITWRVGLREEERYFLDWRWPGMVERALALSAGLLNVPWMAPLAIVPRLLVARSRGVSLGGERLFWLDTVLGLVLSVVLGFAIIRFVRY